MEYRYLLDKEDEKLLFKNAIIVFDTSSLLDFYYYSGKTQNEIFNTVFKKIKNRLWIPFQVFYEFQKNREKVMTKPIETYKSLLSKNKHFKDSGHFEEIHSTIKKFKTEQIPNINGQLNTLIEKTRKDDKHPFFQDQYFDQLKKRIKLLDEYLLKTDEEFKTFKKKLELDINKKIKQIEDIKSSDSVHKAFNNFFTVGDEWSYEKLMDIVKDGEIRYKNEIPPGFEDFEEKSGFQKYGDLILWKQILDYTNKNGNPVIFITNDNKKDWWHFDGNIHTKSPRHELILEFNSNNDQNFWMYNSNDFLFKINEILNLEIEDSSIQEVKEVYESHSTLDKESIIGEWLSKKYDWTMFLAFEDKEKDIGLDFMRVDEDRNKQGFYIKKGIASNYTSVLGNLKKAILNKSKVIVENDLFMLTQVLELKNKSNALKVAKHLERSNPSKLLIQNESDFSIIVGYFDKSKKEFITTFVSEN